MAFKCGQNFLNMIFEIEPIFVISIQQLISLESYLKMDPGVGKLLPAELFNIISKLLFQHYTEMGCRQS